MGALLLHDTVWVLPATPQTRENFQWLASEILEGGYEAMLWEAQLPLPGQDAALREQFLASVDGKYEAILDALDRDDADAALLARRYQQVSSQDYLQSGRGLKAREALLHAARRAPR